MHRKRLTMRGRAPPRGGARRSARVNLKIIRDVSVRAGLAITIDMTRTCWSRLALRRGPDSHIISGTSVMYRKRLMMHRETAQRHAEVQAELAQGRNRICGALSCSPAAIVLLI